MAYRPQEVTIVGAGLVGSLLAVLLGQRGYRVRVLERRGDMRQKDVDSGRSINLALSERGIYALRTAGLMEEVEKLLIPMRGRQLHLANGSEEFSPYGQREEEVIYSVSRELLNCLMMTAAEKHPDVQVVFDRKATRIDFEGNRITLQDTLTEELTEHEFEILIGADGAGSKVRQAMMEVTDGESRSEFLDHDYKELEIPPANDGQHQIPKEALHIWPRGGFMLIALPNLDGSFTVTLFLSQKGETSFESLDSPDRLMDFFKQEFPSALRLIPQLAEDFYSNPTGRLGTVRCDRWFYQNDSLILGDASHAIVPFHGQGMNSGFEDCSELIRLLDQFNEDWDQVLPEFDRLRRPCANAIADMALENYITMRDSVRDPKFQLKKELGFHLERQFPTRFIPRYSMVMFHRIPYDEVYRHGIKQEEILDQLVAGCDRMEEINLRLAGELIGSLQELQI